MHGAIYMKWLENRLIPTFKKLFPNKKMVLVLDNASYHHVRGEDWITPSKLNKLALACVLGELRVEQMIVKRKLDNGVEKEFRFRGPSFFNPASKSAPTVDELR